MAVSVPMCIQLWPERPRLCVFPPSPPNNNDDTVSEPGVEPWPGCCLGFPVEVSRGDTTDPAPMGITWLCQFLHRPLIWQYLLRPTPQRSTHCLGIVLKADGSRAMGPYLLPQLSTWGN